MKNTPKWPVWAALLLLPLLLGAVSIEKLTHEKSKIRLKTATKILNGEMPRTDAEDIYFVNRALKDPEPKVRLAAVLIATTMDGDEALKLLAETCVDEDSAVVEQAMSAIVERELSPDQAVGTVIALYNLDFFQDAPRSPTGTSLVEDLLTRSVVPDGPLPELPTQLMWDDRLPEHFRERAAVALRGGVELDGNRGPTELEANQQDCKKSCQALGPCTADAKEKCCQTVLRGRYNQGMCYARADAAIEDCFQLAHDENAPKAQDDLALEACRDGISSHYPTRRVAQNGAVGHSCYAKCRDSLPACASKCESQVAANYEPSCEAGEQRDCFNLAQMILTTDSGRSWSLLQGACDGWVGEACLRLAKYSQDKVKAQDYRHRACVSGLEEACAP